nr:hypothetical protein [uncultured bacterium]
MTAACAILFFGALASWQNFLVIRWMVKLLSVCTTPMASRLT